MSMNLKSYAEYKDSGVQWLGQVPKHWKVLPNRAVFGEVIEKNLPEEELLSVTISRGVIRQKELLENSSKKDSSNENKANYKLVQPNDIVYNKMRAWQGALGVSQYRGIVSPAYIVIRPRDNNHPRYFHYLFRTPHFHKEAERWSYGITSDQWSLRSKDFKQIYCVIPPRDEQDTAIRFLGHFERLIAQYIRNKQKTIALLNEQKQAILQRAVTQGLDPNVRLKHSGIDWLGNMPIDWQVTYVRRLISFITSGSRGWAEFYSDSGDFFIQSGNLSRRMTLDLEHVQRVTPPSGAEGLRTRIAKDDILVCITGALTGNVALVSIDLPPAYVNQHVALLRPDAESITPRFLAYSLYSNLGQLQFKLTEYGGTKQGLGLDDVRNIVILLPSREEQHKIVADLDMQTTRIWAAIDRIVKEIDLIREYRTRLIADVVTGKMDVRGVKVPETQDEAFLEETLEEMEDSPDIEEAA